MSNHHSHDCAHSHDHSHDCADDHTHNHDHEHGCADDHNHSHGREHGCAHDHEHNHDHNHDHEQSSRTLQLQEHEGAVVASAEIVFEDDYTKVRNTLSEALEEIACWVKEQGGTVGHIKAALSFDDYVVVFSITGETVHQHEQKSGICRASIAIIVFGICPDELKALVEKTLPF